MSLRLAGAAEGSVVAESADPRDEAFEILYRRYFPRLVRMLLHRTGEHSVAEDIAQETLVKAFTRYEHLDLSQPIWPWLKTIATNLVIDQARTAGREVAYESPPTRTEGWCPESDEDGSLIDAIANLPQKQQVAVSLRYLDGWKTGEAADFLGMGRPAFEQLLFRARRNLRTEYGRVRESILGTALIPLRWLRRSALRASQQVRASGGGMGPMSLIGSDLTAQLVGGLLVLVTASGATAIPNSDPPLSSNIVARAVRGDAGTRSETADGTPSSGRAVAPPGRDLAATGAEDAKGEPFSPAGVVRRVTDPNENVRQPEDSNITSIVFGSGDDGAPIYAAGRTQCGSTCSRVLFRSTDGGASWSRLDANGFEGGTLIVPPGGDGRVLFAMSPVGLQVSRDGGQNFELATTAGAPVTIGSAAVSPGFFSGDASVLIGSQTLIRYRDSTGTSEPYPAALTGPLYPAYSPTYPEDGRIFVGGVAVRPETNETVSAVHTCTGLRCDEVQLNGAHLSPQLRLANDFYESNTLAAYGKDYLFVSRDDAERFAQITPPLRSEYITDVALPDEATLFAATMPTSAGGSGGLWMSRDGGILWHNALSPMLESGAVVVAASDDRVLVALENKGIACSTDYGATWSARCP